MPAESDFLCTSASSVSKLLSQSAYGSIGPQKNIPSLLWHLHPQKTLVDDGHHTTHHWSVSKKKVPFLPWPFSYLYLVPVLACGFFNPSSTQTLTGLPLHQSAPLSSPSIPWNSFFHGYSGEMDRAISGYPKVAENTSKMTASLPSFLCGGWKWFLQFSLDHFYIWWSNSSMTLLIHSLEMHNPII